MSFLLGERFCKVISNNSCAVSIDELIKAVDIIYKGDINDRIKFVFKIYDFNNNDIITPAGVRLIISHIPAISSASKDDSNFEFFKQTQADITSLISDCFVGKEYMNLYDFIKVTNEKSSDMFIAVL